MLAWPTDTAGATTIERTQEAYERRRADLARLEDRIEQVIGQTYHYGIRVWSEPKAGRDPVWRITDPYQGQDRYAFAWYEETPPPVGVYTREQYETAARTVGLEPADDEDLRTYADRFFEISVWDLEAIQAIGAILRRRRMAGLERERARVQRERQTALAGAGLGSGPYAREQYEHACQVMGAEVLSDDGCVAVVDQDLARVTGGTLVVGIPVDRVSVDLASRRVQALEQHAAAGRRCGECGTTIIGAGMAANFGLACGVGCYEAMAERPGRYASRVR
jgi:hypothetical protein